MARAAIIENGLVTNVVVADDPADVGGIACDNTVSIGWIYDGEAFTPPPSAPPTRP